MEPAKPAYPADVAEVCFDQELIERYDGRGPRYTSYPTALQFSDAFDDWTYVEAVVASNRRMRPLSVYVHLPFCKSLCYYCGCTKVVTRNADRIQSYLDALHAEIRMQSELFDPRRRVSQLHFGGGTPTYLSDEQLTGLMRTLDDNLTLDRGDDHEFSIEIDPRTMQDHSMALLRDLGFNRVSIGVQDFDRRVQVAVNRLQPEEQVRELVDQARAVDFRSVSFDLIYGLPHQSVRSFDRTLDAVVDIRPDRLAIYNYAHLPGRFKGQRLIRSEDLPSPGAKLTLLQHTIARLTSAGYAYIGMDHFALPEDDLVRAKLDGTLQRNFQGYSTHAEADLLALGASAIGKVGDTFAQNVVDTKTYEARIAAGRLAIGKGLVVDADDQIRAAVIQDIMCHDGLRFDRLRGQYGLDVESYFSRELLQLQPLAADGLVELAGDGIRVTARGRLLLRNIAMVFDRYLTAAAANERFSRAI